MRPRGEPLRSTHLLRDRIVVVGATHLEVQENRFGGRFSEDNLTGSCLFGTDSAVPDAFFKHPILNSPYEYPARHWELDHEGQPTERIVETRRRAKFVTPIPKPKKRRNVQQAPLVFDEGKGLSTEEQQYDPTSIINRLRGHLDAWRALPKPSDWGVTPETARLLDHWRNYPFQGIRPFFCQVEAVETAIWLTEVAPHFGKAGKRFIEHLAAANEQANPGLARLALKLATGAGKTTVMAMLIAWQTVNAVRRPGSKSFTRGFLIVTPGLTIRDRLRVLQPNDPDSYFKNRELLPNDEIARFRREIVERTGNPRDAENLSDQELLREVMNTVGKKGTLGESIRCVVSVSMLTEGWDANTVTHVLGVRAFGTQLLCEQVIGRALRRQSYDLNAEGLFDVEYADVLGIPFDFTAKPVVVGPTPPRESIRVHAVRPERDALEIRFPRVEGYRVDLPEERLRAEFNDDSVLELTPDLVGPSITRNEGIIGEGVDLNLRHTRDMRRSSLLYELTKRLLYTKWRDTDDQPKLYLFSQLKRIVRQWLDTCLVCKGGTYPAQLVYQELADMACQRITAAILDPLVADEKPVVALLDRYNPEGSTRYVNFYTSKKTRWETDSRRCHVNWAVCDSDWEAELCRVVEAHPKVLAYVKNQGLGFEVPYRYGSVTRRYRPDFILVVNDGGAGPLHLVVEIKGYRREDAKEKKNTMDAYWVPGVNNLEQYGRWAFAELTDVYQIEADLIAILEAELDKMIDGVTAETA